MALYNRRAWTLFLVVLCLCELLIKSSYALQDQEWILSNKPAVSSNLNNIDVGAVRCYCNLPVCVGTSYMCRSERGGCFSDAADRSQAKQKDTYRARHGCIEFLAELQQGLECYNASRGANASNVGLMWCCFKDMCNHVDNLDIRNLSTIYTGGVTRTELYDDSQTSTSGNAINDDWFKAATIAVPICGALILFVLIALAVKILKTEGVNDQASKLGSHYIPGAPAQMHYSGPTNSLNCMPLLLQVCDNGCTDTSSNHSTGKTSTSALPLLVQNHTRTKLSYEKKNELNAKLNLINNLEYNLKPGTQDNNSYKAKSHLSDSLNKDNSLLNTNSSSTKIESKSYNKNIGWS
ncbi:uncharacterized protein LOC113385226 [Ctenocephalides felis]|uniref:uncharacterized protein LOC113385226 n=1 Tax=Ctenocephalides felis TaxID=7515 RepID=UPI000E6E4702|nr:uncharacterized protein LOC113385226 [Ctenocephalides felis]